MNLLLGISEDGNTDSACTIRVQRPDLDPLINETTGLATFTHTVIYEGTAYIVPVVFRRSRQEYITEEQASTRTYRILAPYNAGDIHLEDIVTVLTCSDADFINRRLRVMDVMYETDQAVRRFDVVDAEDDDEVTYPR